MSAYVAILRLLMANVASLRVDARLGLLTREPSLAAGLRRIT